MGAADSVCSTPSTSGDYLGCREGDSCDGLNLGNTWSPRTMLARILIGVSIGQIWIDFADEHRCIQINVTKEQAGLLDEGGRPMMSTRAREPPPSAVCAVAAISSSIVSASAICSALKPYLQEQHSLGRKFYTALRFHGSPRHTPSSVRRQMRCQMALSWAHFRPDAY